ncbi:LysR substrate-binding domain-containing protein [Pseudohoeflea coraliihabitans]|uniref:LysR family transcriptional regulator n=1 Tax=Pseudohoeflea coraliihabitans TaxID=2860393 RepID=A0ABS6WJJ9_9HYPH|nr:LysR substrate-binding domain-containing protein [Pseudohoeflea sp. DP4N28-3]MBW3095823.1 LysR family transcriptional regulator [Pseudohoeflea sp. DP4N28-3]
MTLDQIRIFIAVAERLHVTRASEALHLTQSAVSASIASLERQYNVQLFRRVGRGIHLTEAGSIFLEEARALVAHADSTRLSLSDLGAETRGRIRIHASQTVANYWLPPFLVQLHERHPGIEIKLKVGNTSEVAKAVHDLSADIGFVEGEITEGGLDRHQVASDDLVMFMRKEHPLSQRSWIGPRDYRGQKWILREVGSGTRSAFIAHLERLGMSADELDIIFDLPSNEAVLAAVASSECVTVLSRRAASGATAFGRLKMVPLQKAHRAFAMLLHPEKRRTRAVAALVDFIKAS